jgi:hypothetical protein
LTTLPALQYSSRRNLLVHRCSQIAAMKPTFVTPLRHRWMLALSLLVLICTSVGCLGMRLRDRVRDRLSGEDSLSEAPSLPKAEFGRQKSPMQQMGTDRRSREIEASLGVGG